MNQRAENARRNFTTHGMTNSPTHKAWMQMRSRCNNPNRDHYTLYGGRGIQCCERWSSFENFLADMGEKPEGLTLERKDPDGNYTPENCVWASIKAQTRNRRNNCRLTLKGVTRCIGEWSELLSIPYARLYGRKLLGWTDERILTTPKRGNSV